MASLPKSHTDQRAQFSRAPIADALEDAACVFHLMGDKFRPIDPAIAEACHRANRGFWSAASVVRGQEMGK